ncbi:MAG: hypothetical protein HZB79_10875 [Deltaproteobacteria bacterium]|nr:hypothetical protein [Deltaproteobacteria bacterium]
MTINPANNPAVYGQSISVQSFKKALDVQKLEGEAAVKLIEQANIQDDIANEIDIIV